MHRWTSPPALWLCSKCYQSDPLSKHLTLQNQSFTYAKYVKCNSRNQTYKALFWVNRVFAGLQWDHVHCLIRLLSKQRPLATTTSHAKLWCIFLKFFLKLLTYNGHHKHFVLWALFLFICIKITDILITPNLFTHLLSLMPAATLAFDWLLWRFWVLKR